MARYSIPYFPPVTSSGDKGDLPVYAVPYTHLGSARMTSLKGHNNKAQGNALGIGVGPVKALKGRQNRSFHTGLARVI